MKTLLSKVTAANALSYFDAGFTDGDIRRATLPSFLWTTTSMAAGAAIVTA